MRLTLRTLLAFRDGVLEPQDAAALEQKIRDSSTAQQISKRIEEGMRNRKIAPIPVDAREFGFDANLVAEFLDDTIQVELLPEMERKCLENNALLSEIGSCHQILSRALSVPVSIPGSLRQRIRELPSNPSSILAKSLEAHGNFRRIDRGTITTAKEGTPLNLGNSIAASGSLRKRKAELRTSGIELNDVLGKQVPEYLIGSDRGWWKRAAVAASLLISLVAIGAVAVGPIERVSKLLNRSSQLAQDLPSVKRLDRKQSDELEPPVATIDAVDAASKSTTAIIPNSNESGDSALTIAPADLINSSETTKLAEPNNASVAIPNNRAPRIVWLPEDKSSSESIVLAGTMEADSSVPKWERMSAGAAITTGQRLLVPPAQRTEVRIEPGIRWLCAGENDIELLPTGIVSLKAGRAILFATPDAQSFIVDCHGVQMSIRFRANDSSCALEVLNRLEPTDNETVDSGTISVSHTVRLLGVQNEVDYTVKGPNPNASTGTLSVGQFQSWKDGIASSGHRDLVEAPWWLRTSYERGIDRLSAEDLHRALSRTDSSSIEAELIKLTQSRRAENAALATRYCIMMGRYDSLLSSEGALNRKELYSHWNYIIDQVSQSLGRAENQMQFVTALRAHATGRFSSLLGLFVPKTQMQLANGSDKLLVEALSSATMDERVLAIHQLAGITGKNLGFHPDKNSVEAIQAWRKLLGKGEIRYPESQSP